MSVRWDVVHKEFEWLEHQSTSTRDDNDPESDFVSLGCSRASWRDRSIAAAASDSSSILLG